VGQLLLGDSDAGSEEGSLFYWSRTEQGGKAELDYLIARRGELIPVEVKNGPAGKLRSLDYFTDKRPKLKISIVLRDIDRVNRLGSFKCIEAPLYTKLD
jgi:hypothetical protein